MLGGNRAEQAMIIPMCTLRLVFPFISGNK